MYIYNDVTHTHTYIHIHIYIYIIKKRDKFFRS